MKINVNDDTSYLYRGLSHYHLENFKQATKDLTKAARSNPKFIELYKYRSMAYELGGDEARAKADAKKVDALLKKS